MRFTEFAPQIASQPCFSFDTACSLAGWSRPVARVQLSRWCDNGLLVRLHRGFYALGEAFRSRPLSGPRAANSMREPSYLSGLWVLNRAGMIPEAIFTYTSVTTQPTACFKNSLGRFSYESIKPELFWGNNATSTLEKGVHVAEPEKALLDYFWLRPGDWPEGKIEAELRLQWSDHFHEHRFLDYAKQFESDRISRIADRALAVLHRERDSWKEVA